MSLKDKKVVVVGMGNSGVNASLLLKDIGADVWITDSGDTSDNEETLKKLKAKGMKVETGCHTKGFIHGSDLMVLSPGVDGTSHVVKWAEECGIPIIGEMELGYRFCKGKIIAITGTNGKSTVTTLIGEILKNGRKDTVVCGNIGNSLCGELARIKPDTWVVLEVSSFQLERIEHFRPNIAVILNITDDHMDRYKNFGQYFVEKLKIFSNQDKGDTLILNHDAENLRELKKIAHSRSLFYSRSNTVNGAYLKDGHIFCVRGDKEHRVCHVTDIPVKGLHNIENVLASSLVGILAGIEPDLIKAAVKNFKGLKHRFETVEKIGGVEYIDDSKGTAVDSTIRALESCEKPVVLIAGGKDKHSNYGLAKDIIKEKVKHLVLIGEASQAIKKALEGAVAMHDARDMNDAVRKAASLAEDGWCVLLSPMCSSFDMFKSYKERGDVFRKALGEMKRDYEKADK